MPMLIRGATGQHCALGGLGTTSIMPRNMANEPWPAMAHSPTAPFPVFLKQVVWLIASSANSIKANTVPILGE